MSKRFIKKILYFIIQTNKDLIFFYMLRRSASDISKYFYIFHTKKIVWNCFNNVIYFYICIFQFLEFLFYVSLWNYFGYFNCWNIFIISSLYFLLSLHIVTRHDNMHNWKKFLSTLITRLDDFNHPWFSLDIQTMSLVMWRLVALQCYVESNLHTEEKYSMENRVTQWHVKRTGAKLSFFCSWKCDPCCLIIVINMSSSFLHCGNIRATTSSSRPSNSM
jgi:hypothetical protein